MSRKLALRIILYLLAAVCVAYSVIVAQVNSGSFFFIIWDVIAAFLVFVGVALKLNLWSRIGKKLKRVIITLFSVGLTALIIFLAMIFSAYKEEELRQVDYLIVLGAQVREDGPSLVLKYRLDTAIDYLNQYPNTMCIVSGCQGDNEPYSEAEGMKRYLVECGIAADRIITEDQSTNTRENFIYSKKLLPEGASVGIVTNNFHMCRAMYLARKMGIESPLPVIADSKPLYAPNNVFREVFGLIKDMIV